MSALAVKCRHHVSVSPESGLNGGVEWEDGWG